VTWLIDTNIISEVRKGPRCHPAVAAWWAGVEDRDLFLSALTLGEIRKGIEGVRPRDPGRAAALEGWLAEVVDERRDGDGRPVAALHFQNRGPPEDALDGRDAFERPALALHLATRVAQAVHDRDPQRVLPAPADESHHGRGRCEAGLEDQKEGRQDQSSGESGAEYGLAHDADSSAEMRIP